jgi:hypothetical protein
MHPSPVSAHGGPGEIADAAQLTVTGGEKTLGEGLRTPAPDRLLLPHDPTGWVFKLYHTRPGPGRVEGWRRCHRCAALFFDGYDDAKKGVCPRTADGHEAAPDGLPYILQWNVKKPRPDQQPDWRFCERCYCLFFYPHNSDAECAATGGHHKPPSAQYVLTRADA